MRNLLAFLAALTLTLAAVGWYLDWYQIRRTPAPSGQRSVTVDINTQKISQDLLEAEKRIQKRLAEKARSTADPKVEKRTPDVPPANVGVILD